MRASITRLNGGSIARECDDSASLSLPGRRQVQICGCGNLIFAVSSSLMQVQILTGFSRLNARNSPLRQPDRPHRSHYNLPTSDGRLHHGHRWLIHRPSWLWHLLSLLPLLLSVRVQRYWGYRSLPATCMHLVSSKCRQLPVHSLDGRTKALS